MLCSKCSFANPSGSSYCSRCGTFIEPHPKAEYNYTLFLKYKRAQYEVYSSRFSSLPFTEAQQILEYLNKNSEELDTTSNHFAIGYYKTADMPSNQDTFFLHVEEWYPVEWNGSRFILKDNEGPRDITCS